MKIKLSIVGIAAFFLLNRLILGAVTPISPADLDSAITKHTLNYDFILIDVRDYREVAGGIIASGYCKPYHMSWNSGEFNNNMQLLPKNVRIIVYCESGNRSSKAALKLVNAGYELVGSMTGGTGSYKGNLADSTEFKPLSKLPEASYFGTLTAVSRKDPQFRIVVPTNEKRQQFTLQGRTIRQVGREQNAPVYILERIGDDTKGKINGLHRLVQERE
jgi:rhodanese-related sulfurtransferase